MRNKKALEFLILFVLLPLLIMLLDQRRLLLMLLWLATAYVIYVLKRNHEMDFRAEWNARAITREALLPILARFGICAVALMAFTLGLEPERFLSFPLQRPGTWLLVMFFYPLLSVAPQELVFRSFFFRRYADLFTKNWHMATLSALAFGFVHIALGWVAVILSGIGGWFFARTYDKHKSLALVVLEHALYGCFVFTIGLGWYFYSGRQ